jgi:hypothetical protein
MFLICFLRAAEPQIMTDENFKIYLSKLDRRPPAKRVAHLIKSTPDPWNRPDGKLADEILGNIKREKVARIEVPTNATGKEKDKSAELTDDERSSGLSRRSGKKPGELTPKKILRNQARQVSSQSTINVDMKYANPKRVRIDDDLFV